MKIWRVDAQGTGWSRENFLPFSDRLGWLEETLDTHLRRERLEPSGVHYIVPTLEEVRVMEVHAFFFTRRGLFWTLNSSYPSIRYSSGTEYSYEFSRTVCRIPERSPLERLCDGQGRIAFGFNLPTSRDYLKGLRAYEHA